ncbi:phospholipase D1-like isoform X2 [Clavelina lepadiformis]|uniref:phospholipase D1-like isoform X2 n=1 Tax=Clavelina lepadiformis TaxID=159417 RepID=UPI004042E2A5
MADDIQSENDQHSVSEEEPGPSKSPGFVTMDVTQSVLGDQYDVLPLPSPGIEELDNVCASSLGIKHRIPYMSIYSSPSRLLVGLNSSFLSKTKVSVEIPDSKHDVTYRHALHPNLYKIDIEHGQFSWTIHRRYNHFSELHEKLWGYRTSLKIPVPLKRHRRMRKSRHGLPKTESKIPRFPRRPEVMMSLDAVTKRQGELELYLNAMLESRLYRNHSSTKTFLEVSRLSFIQDLGVKSKEGVIRKLSGGHKIGLDLCGRCSSAFSHNVCRRWSKRWFVVKDTFAAYMDPEQEKLKGVILFDHTLTIHHQSGSSNLDISNSSRSLTINCWTERQALEWKQSLVNCSSNLCAGLTSPEIRHESFAPLRPDSYADWFVDGSSYFAAVADAMESAKEEIFITDWWLSPEIFLKRPMTEGDYWRLDKVLKRKAAEGVKIYVQLYKEVEVAIGLDSAYTKRTLTKLHPQNIRVMRHPDLSPEETLLWAHHEKVVVVDQSVAFIGGIDLCYGRWDDHLHRLTDVGTGGDVVDGENLDDTPQTTSTAHSMTALAFGMFGTMTMGVVNQVGQKEEQPKPKAAQLDSMGAKEKNKLKKFLTKGKRKSSEEFDSLDFSPSKTEPDGLVSSTSQGYGSLNETTPLFHADIKSTTETVTNGKPKGKTEIYLEQYKEMVTKADKMGKSRLWIGKDYNNFILKDLTNLDDPFEDEIDRNKVARMPWHDIACVTYGKAARDAARHFIQRWNFSKIQKKKTGEHVTFLLPKCYSDDTFNISPDQILPNAVKADVQILRSSCEWSAGISKTERSIQNAYLDAIERAEHFIYIENQFFITCRENPQVQNSICEALYRKIVQTHERKKNFRVYVIMPLVPGFEGDISDSSKSRAIRTVLDWQYKSILRGSCSLMEALNKTIGEANSWKYVSFCGLRTHSKLKGKPVTEMIYVHSKMMIVDDRLVIIGSANINDRSMTGERDSEVAMLIEDTQFTQAIMDEKPYNVGLYAASLRRRCFCEHLGFLPKDYDGTSATFDPLHDEAALKVSDIVADKFFKDTWMKTAAVNTTIYEKVFKCVPSDYIRTLENIPEFQKGQLVEQDAEAAEKELLKVNGYLVLLPLLFLIDEDLTPDVMTKEGIAPTNLWT